MRDLLERCRRRRPRTPTRRDPDRRARRAHRVRGARRARPARSARAATRRSWRVVAAPFALLARARRSDVAVPPRSRLARRSPARARSRATSSTRRSTCAAPTRVEQLELVLVAPGGLEVAEGENPVRRPPRQPARSASSTLRRSAATAGAPYQLGDVRLRARDRLGLVAWEGRSRRAAPLRVYPPPELLRSLVSPARHAARRRETRSRGIKGDGLEFADTRPFVRRRPAPVGQLAGDGAPWPADRQRAPPRPEHRRDRLPRLVRRRAQRRTRARSTAPCARAATLATLYLERRDRVGLVTFGGVLRWLEPAAASRSATGSSTRSSRPASSSARPGRTSNVIPARVAAAEGARARRDAAPRRARRSRRCSTCAPVGTTSR